jgi:ABC-type sugar transport system permease subunit
MGHRLNNLTVPLTLTAGGPGSATMTISIELYRQTFKFYHFGEASALSIVLIALNFILMVLYIKAVKYEI